jgi:GT2 family glycosyltransferase
MNDLTVIITLYKTPKKQLENLKSYKGLKTYIMEQSSEKNIKKELLSLIGKDLKYYRSKKNIGLSKSSNFLLSKVKTKYCLFTQADIKVDKKSINELKNFFIKKKDFIFVGPKITSSKIKKQKYKKREYKIVKKLDCALLLIDTKKIKEIGFFDIDYFLYWEDISLMDKINKSKYKMAYLFNVCAFHLGEKSSIKNYKTDYIRWSNYRYGEYLYDYKSKNFKTIKILRRIMQNLIFSLMNIILFRYNKLNLNLANLGGIFKFYKFYLNKKL